MIVAAVAGFGGKCSKRGQGNQGDCGQTAKHGWPASGILIPNKSLTPDCAKSRRLSIQVGQPAQNLSGKDQFL
jgi:hypothetical protein